MPVRCCANIALEEVRTRVDGRLKRRQRVLCVPEVLAAMSDDSYVSPSREADARD